MMSALPDLAFLDSPRPADRQLPEKPKPILCGGVTAVKEVGAEAAGAFEGLVAAPLGDLAVVAGEEDVGDLHVAKDLGAGVLRIFEQAVTEGVVAGGIVVAQGAGQQADDRVDDDQCGQFPAVEDIITDGDLLGVQADTIRSSNPS